ncbi:LacI family DNA-binding transcriptional regulator [Rhizobium bangladeshense]|uniref:LacI family DNA-binding transcriptional regulator n=1 Tax=Rhizobium bangladeshense TaxID=1138189 RepID=UPI0009EE2869
MVDIALLAGVNPSTISRALSGSSAVTPQTRARIAQIARESGYIALKAYQARLRREKNSRS